MNIKNISNTQQAYQAYKRVSNFDQQVKSPSFSENLKQAMTDYNHNIHLGQNLRNFSVNPAEKTALFTKFENTVTHNFKSLKNIFAKAENETNKVLLGEADSVELITSIKQAESLFETIVAVKNSLMNAYSEIIKMPM